MDAMLQRQSIFHLTGKRPATGLESVDRLRPALFARYRELARLRYDFPLVLRGGFDPFVRPLSLVVNDLVGRIAPSGIEGEGLRRQVLAVEREIRRRVAQGERGTLAALWERAVEELARAPAGTTIGTLLAQAGTELGFDGELIDCDASLPARFISEAWRSAQARKARRARTRIDALIVRLGDLLRADLVRSETGRRPASLAAAVGGHHRELFDFEAMSRMLAHAPPVRPLADRRRRRIEGALATLRAQRFFGAAAGTPELYRFDFHNGAEAVSAFRERMPQMVELVKAMALAELEVGGRYVEEMHDPFFAAYDEQALGPSDVEFFPDYLVCLSGALDPAEQITLMELLSAGVPVKVLVQVDDILEDKALGEGHVAFGVRGMQLASAAVGLGDCFVLQSASSNLWNVLRSVERGMDYAGPALFSVFSGTAGRSGGLAPYLVAAAAMQSRAFPAFTYDPSAGEGLADRFSLEDNPQPGLDWPLVPFEFADGDLQRVTETVAFTFLDFVACDVRYSHHFACVPHESWSDLMVPAANWLAAPPADGGDRVPYLLAVDDEDVLQRVIADEHIVRAARRCRETWHRLQELGGVRSSHAERRLERERGIWEAEKAREIDAIRASAAPRAASVPPAGPIVVPIERQPTAEAPPAPERSKDEAYIETARCSSCNECTQINDRMFAYNEDKQAYLKDVGAGTYRQLVEAAESCQLSIIHPGKPRDPNEPGLAELLERAQPFL